MSDVFNFPNIPNIIDYINVQSKEIHEWAVGVGWWDRNRLPEEVCQLMVNEVVEANEAARVDAMDDKLPHRKGEEVEAIDTLIRALDTGGKYNLSYLSERKNGLLMARTHYCGNCLEVERDILMFFGSLEDYHSALSLTDDIDAAFEDLEESYTDMINSILTWCHKRGYDVEAVVREKMEINHKRVDHTRENRAKVGGKKW